MKRTTGPSWDQVLAKERRLRDQFPNQRFVHLTSRRTSQVEAFPFKLASTLLLERSHRLSTADEISRFKQSDPDIAVRRILQILLGA
jgi:hypothetical protein